METTNYCNACCSYCVHKDMTRELGYVTMETVAKVINYMERNNQKYLALHHMGEPLLHPKIGEIINEFYKSGIKTELSTNGLLLPKKGKEILETGIGLVRIAVDQFYNKKGFRKQVRDFLELSKDYPDTKIKIHTVNGNDLTMFEPCMYNSVDLDIELKTLDNWGGQLDRIKSKMPASKECYFTDHNYVCILWDGTVVSCCNDYDGKYPLTMIDKLDKVQINSTTPLCKGCKKLQFAEGGAWVL